MGCSVLPLASAVSTLGGLVFGYELGIISGALLQLKAEFRLSCLHQEVLVSSLLIGALLASVVGGYVIDRHGRRNSILLSNVLILTGSLILLISSYVALVVGRTTVGFAMCMSSMSCCIFVSELVSPDRRGSLVTLYEAGITVGILAAYAINYILFDSSRGWRWMFGFALAPALLQLLAVCCLPSSTKEPLNSDGPQAEINLMSPSEIQDGSFTDSEGTEYGHMYLFRREDNMRTRTAIGLGLVLFQQFTGQPNVLLYASTIFHSVGFRSNTSAVLASVGLGVVKVLATLTSMGFADRVGRRPLLISGCAVMAVGLITIGLLSGDSAVVAGRPCNSDDAGVNVTAPPRLTDANRLMLDAGGVDGGRRPPSDTGSGNTSTFDQVEGTAADAEAAPRAAVNWLVFTCLTAVVGAYAVGFGPMTWLLLSEIFPPAVRGRAFAFTNCFNWAANLLVTCTFLNLMEWIGLSGVFVLYGATAVAAAIFFYFLLPETRGKSLQEIDTELCLTRVSHEEQCCGRLAPRRYQRVRSYVGPSE